MVTSSTSTKRLKVTLHQGFLSLLVREQLPFSPRFPSKASLASLHRKVDDCKTVPFNARCLSSSLKKDDYTNYTITCTRGWVCHCERCVLCIVISFARTGRLKVSFQQGLLA